MVSPKQLKDMANKLRIHSIMSTTEAGSGHPTTCMSCADIMSCLFFSVMNKSDDFILSKGHAAPILWAAYAEAGIFPVSRLKDLRKIDSTLEGHPTKNMSMIHIATGSLGQGLSAGLGMALANRVKKEKGIVYVLLGDGEMAEGSVWEAANAAAYHKADNLTAIVDVNRLGQSQETMHGHNMKRYKAKFDAFGWDSVIIEGHDINALLRALGKKRRTGKPLAILARTMKGKGFPEVEDKDGWHGKPFEKDMMQRAVKSLQAKGNTDIKLRSGIRKAEKIRYSRKSFKPGKYRSGEMVATRTAYGNALVRLGKSNNDAVVIDGDVKNSTRTGFFFKEFPKRSFESFIAEQNMLGMAQGFSAKGLVPFAATFSAFLTRAHDFIRMAAYSGSNIKLCGSHAGVSIGQDGPSQMGLEDISMFISTPDSAVLYPCDAVSAEVCVKETAKHAGISYIRTTREKTPVIYSSNEKFPIGGLKVIKKTKKDKLLIVAAGVTVHEALKAYDKLSKEGIDARVIDLYSVKPVDTTKLLMNARECRNNVIVVEDHYDGGIGCAVEDVTGNAVRLYIKEMPRSGAPEKLRKKYGIDSSAIVRAAKKLAGRK
ncbi:transketolase [Candidatus Woesearchaeota archaeon]|nr:transketolase [Candidatus Woesearchaeota archaeon]